MEIGVSLAVIALAGLVEGSRRAGLLPSPPAHAAKSYATFEAFYPFYLEQHSALTTKRMHYLGTALLILLILASGGRLVLPLAAGVCAGYAAFHRTRSLGNGLLEMLAMLASFVAAGVAATGSFALVLSPLILAYGCAWIGHFFFERNRPATFIYPTWSLLGDFRMFYDALCGAVPL